MFLELGFASMLGNDRWEMRCMSEIPSMHGCQLPPLSEVFTPLAVVGQWACSRALFLHLLTKENTSKRVFRVYGNALGEEICWLIWTRIPTHTCGWHMWLDDWASWTDVSYTTDICREGFTWAKVSLWANTELGSYAERRLVTTAVHCIIIVFDIDLVRYYNDRTFPISYHHILAGNRKPREHLHLYYIFLFSLLK